MWQEHHEATFNKIKDNIGHLTENTHFNINRKTRVKTDASRGGLGAVLEQETCDGWVTIAYASRFLNKAEEKYSINELELLGVVWALEHFKHYLLGHKFTVQTDHRALLSILKERSSKIHQSRLTRWCDRQIPFTFTIEHIPESKMGMADYMSRNPDQIASPPSTYDADFIIAQINVIKDTLNIIFAPAGDHRAIGLVERLVQTVKRRLGCIKLDPNQTPFNIKQALSQITYELRICRKKSTKISPFEAHHGRKPNTALSNATTTAHKSNLDWSNTIHAYLDDNIIGQEDLISDERWDQSDLDSDREVKEAKAKKLKEAKEDTGTYHALSKWNHPNSKSH